MKISSLIAGACTLIYLFGFNVQVTEGISLRALILLRQFAHPQRTRTERPQASWGEWTLWSMCTTTTAEGVRIRSRLCSTDSCNNLPGDNYEIQTCNIKDIPEGATHNKTYLERCTNDPNMNGTLSCRLYRENPIMAYGIFRSARHMHCDNDNDQSSGKKSSSCIFNVVGDAPDTGDVDDSASEGQELVFGRPPKTREGEIGLEFLNQLDTTPLTTGKLNQDGTTTPKQPSFMKNLAGSVLNNRVCADTCERVVLRGTRVSELGSRAPTSLQALLQFLSGNTFFRDNSATIIKEYNSCLTTCSVSNNAVQYKAIRESLMNLGIDPTQQNPNLVVTLNQPVQGTGESRTRRNIQQQNVSQAQYPQQPANVNATDPLVNRVEKLDEQESRLIFNHLKSRGPRHRGSFQLNSPLSTKASTIPIQLETLNNTDDYLRNRSTGPETTTSMPVVNETLLRIKRQLDSLRPSTPNPDDFISPCFERIDHTANSRVLNLDDTEGELFFYEGREQKFMRRRCMGSSIVPGRLYRAQESVRQERTQRLAVCKQGYLVRYGLIIQSDPQGEFTFNDGTRFSIRFRPFKLESHCALSVAAF